MNNQRRKELKHIMNELSALKDELEILKDEEESAYENLP